MIEVISVRNYSIRVRDSERTLVLLPYNRSNVFRELSTIVYETFFDYTRRVIVKDLTFNVFDVSFYNEGSSMPLFSTPISCSIREYIDEFLIPEGIWYCGYRYDSVDQLILDISNKKLLVHYPARGEWCCDRQRYTLEEVLK
jgi:hypothetical protein